MWHRGVSDDGGGGVVGRGGIVGGGGVVGGGEEGADLKDKSMVRLARCSSALVRNLVTLTTILARVSSSTRLKLKVSNTSHIVVYVGVGIRKGGYRTVSDRIGQQSGQHETVQHCLNG